MDDQLPVGQLDLIDKGIHKAAAVGVGALGRGDTELLKQEMTTSRLNVNGSGVESKASW